MFCLQRANPSFKFQKQGFPHYCEVFKAHTDPQIACTKQTCFVFKGLNHLLNFKNKVFRTIAKFSRRTPTRKFHVAFEIQYVYGFYYKTLQAVNRSHTKSWQWKCSPHWTAVKRTTVQVYRLPLHYSIGQLEHDLLAETLHVCMYVCYILYTVHCFRIIDILFKYAYINCKYVVYCNHSHRLWLLTMDRYPIPSGEGGEASKLRNYYSNCHSNLRKIWSWTAGGARHQDGQAGRPPAVMWLRAWPSLKG